MPAIAERTSGWSWSFRLRSPPSAAKQTDNQKQHHRADERHEDRAGDAAERGAPPHSAEQPATEQGTQNSDDDVTQNAEADSSHNQGSQQSSDQPDDDPGQYVHGCLGFRGVGYRLTANGYWTSGYRAGVWCARLEPARAKAGYWLLAIRY